MSKPTSQPIPQRSDTRPLAERLADYVKTIPVGHCVYVRDAAIDLGCRPGPLYQILLSNPSIPRIEVIGKTGRATIALVHPKTAFERYAATSIEV